MEEFTFNWIMLSFLLVLNFYLFSKLHFFKTLFLKSKSENNDLKKKTLNDLAIIELYEKEVKENKNNLKFLQEELANAYIAIRELNNEKHNLKKELLEAEDKVKTMKSKLNMLF